MKHSAKILIIATVLATVTGAAVAARGVGCDQQGGMRGMANGGNMQGMQQMQGKQGMRQGGGMGRIYQLENLTGTQLEKITELRRVQHEKMFNQREQKFKQRAEMRKQLEAILTEEQRAQLNTMRPF